MVLVVESIALLFIPLLSEWGQTSIFPGVRCVAGSKTNDANSSNFPKVTKESYFSFAPMFGGFFWVFFALWYFIIIIFEEVRDRVFG